MYNLHLCFWNFPFVFDVFFYSLKGKATKFFTSMVLAFIGYTSCNLIKVYNRGKTWGLLCNLFSFFIMCLTYILFSLFQSYSILYIELITQFISTIMVLQKRNGLKTAVAQESLILSLPFYSMLLIWTHFMFFV